MDDLNLFTFPTFSIFESFSKAARRVSCSALSPLSDISWVLSIDRTDEYRCWVHRADEFIIIQFQRFFDANEFFFYKMVKK